MNPISPQLSTIGAGPGLWHRKWSEGHAPEAVDKQGGRISSNGRGPGEPRVGALHME